MNSDRLSRASRRGIRLLAASAALTSAAITLAACAPPGSSGTSANAPAVAASTDLGSDPITLTLYDGAGLKTIDDALIAAFTTKHPNVTIETRYDPDNVQSVNAPRVLASTTPPDIARVNALGDIVKSGLLTDLTPWSKLYDWSSLPSGQMAYYTSTSDGVRGDGPQFSLASGFTVTGLYYNKQLMSSLGISETPTTIDQWQSALDKAVAAGKTGIIAGNATGQATFTLQYLLNGRVGQNDMNAWIFDKPGQTIATPAAVEGATTFADWAKKGYFNADANGTQTSDALARFAAGEALFYASGNWDAASVAKQLGDNAGFILPPTSGTSQLAMSDPASNFAIPAKSMNKNAAAAFLAFLTTPEARQIAVDNGFAPSGGGDAPSTSDPLAGDIQKAFATLVAADGQVNFVQNASSGSNTAWTAQVQLLIAGQTSPEDALNAVQTQYEQDLK